MHFCKFLLKLLCCCKALFFPVLLFHSFVTLLEHVFNNLFQKDQKKQSSTTSRLPAYAGGYTPTPIAVLKSKAEKKNKALSDVTEDGSLPPKVKSGKPKEELEKRLSIEDLFDEVYL